LINTDALKGHGMESVWKIIAIAAVINGTFFSVVGIVGYTPSLQG
jgi:hypothetical protein